MTGVPATGTSGLGWRLVSGRRREPSPPAMTTAFNVATSSGLTAAYDHMRATVSAPPQA